jgi:ABC-2 type transport system permease protein
MARNSVHTIWRIAQKELTLFFSSPIAYLFLASFALVNLFIFFWAEAFFARNIADVRPLFEWMPLLLIFLAATLTMRLWSEEKRSGTLEYVLTQPVPIWQFTVGKFLACLVLLAIALCITLPLPISVSLMASLDWGPVISGYLATFLLGAAYLSIGLFVSARAQNQIVSLMTAVALGCLFYLVGSDAITTLFNNSVADILRSIGTGSRFTSIARGMVDFRDLYYYMSIIVVFLTLNTYVLEKQRWAQGKKTPQHSTWRWISALIIMNVLVANITLSPVTELRVDTTAGKQYSISDVTQRYLAQLKEPLLIRGYFSSKTHPLLAPLVPQLKDLIAEYQIAGGDKVKVEIIDPQTDAELEKEANEKYGIKPVPFQVADRYQSAIVSSYFNVLVQYGDQHQVLGFDDLIEVKAKGQSLDVLLRNPEHDLTTAIKKVLTSYQSGGNVFDTVASTVTLTGYVSSEDKLPKQLIDYQKEIKSVLDEFSQQAQGKFQIKWVDPEAGNGEVAQQIAQDYGLQPMATSLFSDQHFYFYFIVSDGNQLVQLPLEELNKDTFKRNLTAGIQRFAQGFHKKVAVVAPRYNPQLAQYGMMSAQFNQLKQYLAADLNVVDEDLTDGQVAGDADILMLLSPQNLTEKQLFAVDQFLMQGGTVIAATSPFSASFMGNRLSATQQTSGLEDWLKHFGLSIDKKLVLDPQNTALPVPVTRDVGGFQLQEMRMLDYPYFIDVRESGLSQQSAITRSLPQVTMAWSSPIIVDEQKQTHRSITPLIKSSEQAWTSDSTDIMPKINGQGQVSYAAEGEQKSYTLAVIAEGQFTSYFADKTSPLLAKTNKASDDDNSSTTEENQDETPASDESTAEDKPFMPSSVIKHSPNSARLIVFASNDFLRDQVVQMVGAAMGSAYVNNSQLIANTLDWALDDDGLSQIRARGHFNRTLPPMDEAEQRFWEYGNYVVALLLLVIIGMIQRYRQQAKQRFYQQVLAQ